MDRPLGRALAGPALIAAGVVWALRDFVVRGRSTSADIVTGWLPILSELGRSLRAGNVPGWTPHVLGGMPFAADAHSGWLQVVPMVLYTMLPADHATVWFVAAHPILAGLGTYAFLRSEGLGRAASTLGGLTLALPLALTRTAVTIRFPSAVAWTVIALACLSRAVRSESRSRRTWWALAAALAWGQIAVSHLGVGLGVGTVAIASYLAATAVARPRGPERRAVARLAAGVAVAAVAVNLAILMPRIAFAGTTSLAGGYERLDELQRELTGRPGPPLPGPSGDAAWGVNLAVVPGGPYLGAGVLGLAALAWRSRRRPLVVALAAFGAASYVFSIGAVARGVQAVAGWVPGIDHYLHGPEWLSMGVLLSLALLAALGLEAAVARGIGASLPAGLAVGAAGAGLLAGAGWGVVPVVAGAAALWAVLRRPGRWVPAAVTALVAAELLVPVLWLEANRDWVDRRPVLATHPEVLLPMRDRTVVLAELLPRGPIAEQLEDRAARFVTISPEDGRFVGDPRALQYNEAQLLELRTASAYRSIQPERHFVAVRAFHGEPIPYNVTTVHDPHPVWLNLLQVGWLVSDGPPPAGASPVASESPWTLYRLDAAPPAASVTGAWEVVPNRDAALRAAMSPGFEDPAGKVALEADPGVASGAPGPAGTATVVARGPQSLELAVRADRDAVVVVRTPWDAGWRARVDGEPAEVIPADGLVQAIPVTAGEHRVELGFDDPWQRWGFAGSAAAIAAGAGWALLGRRRERAVA